mmetsp:Transcript_17226/g.48487  ORF Transcript_17226/g.48487 Transcript_17226/m.48487 type:complete len:213 (-) Transcript_17226:154-792(-)
MPAGIASPLFLASSAARTNASVRAEVRPANSASFPPAREPASEYATAHSPRQSCRVGQPTAPSMHRHTCSRSCACSPSTPWPTACSSSFSAFTRASHLDVACGLRATSVASERYSSRKLRRASSDVPAKAWEMPPISPAETVPSLPLTFEASFWWVMAVLSPFRRCRAACLARICTAASKRPGLLLSNASAKQAAAAGLGAADSGALVVATS